jgi:hypothetical protein
MLVGPRLETTEVAAQRLMRVVDADHERRQPGRSGGFSSLPPLSLRQPGLADNGVLPARV